MDSICRIVFAVGPIKSMYFCNAHTFCIILGMFAGENVILTVDQSELMHKIAVDCNHHIWHYFFLYLQPWQYYFCQCYQVIVCIIILSHGIVVANPLIIHANFTNPFYKRFLPKNDLTFVTNNNSCCVSKKKVFDCDLKIPDLNCSTLV